MNRYFISLSVLVALALAESDPPLTDDEILDHVDILNVVNFVRTVTFYNNGTKTIIKAGRQGEVQQVYYEEVDIEMTETHGTYKVLVPRDAFVAAYRAGDLRFPSNHFLGLCDSTSQSSADRLNDAQNAHRA